MATTESKFIAHEHRELIIFKDRFGKESHLYIPVSEAANRDQHIADQLKIVEAQEQAALAYCTAHGYPLPDE